MSKNNYENKWLRMQFYKNSVIENYGTVKFSGNVADNIRRHENHFDFREIGQINIKGHINWYWQKKQINEYGGNACVVFLANSKPDVSSWIIKPYSFQQEKGMYKILFSKIFPNNEDGVEEASVWTKQIFDEIIKNLKL